MAWSKAKPLAGREQRARLDEEVDLYEFPPNKWVQVRYVGPFTSYAQGWVRIKNPKAGGKKYLMFPKVSLDYNPEKQDFDKEICPYRKGGLYMPQRYLANFIVRDLQEDKPRRQREPTRSERKSRDMLGEKWHCKEMGSKTWTPVRAHDMPAGTANKLANLSELNTRRKNGKKIAYDITDPRRGMDVMVRYNPKAAGAAKWEVQRAEATRLTKEEMNYVIYNLANLKSLIPEDKKTARTEWKRIEPNWRPEKREFGKDKKTDKSSARGRSSSSRPDKSRNKSRNRVENNSSRRLKNKSPRRDAALYDLDDLD